MAEKVVTLPDPRCPFCEAKMELAQLAFYERPDHTGMCWHETWGCDSCHTLHTFPARVEFLIQIKGSQQVPVSARTLFLPK